MATKTKWLSVIGNEKIDEVVNAFLAERKDDKIRSIQYNTVVLNGGLQHHALITYDTKSEDDSNRQAGFLSN